MEFVVIEHREHLRYGVSCLLFFGLAALIFFFIDRERGYLVSIYALGCGLVMLGMCFLKSRKTETFSPEGICMKGVVKTRSIPWSQVIQVGIGVDAEGRASEHFALAFTFVGGTPSVRNQSLRQWRIRNSEGTALSTPYSRDLHELVLRYYGPLDFDCSE